MKTFRAVAFQIVAALMAIQLLSAAQLVPEPGAYRDLIAARSLKCSFPWYVSVDWHRDEPQVKNARQEFGFQIDGINHQQRSARIIGNVGADDLTALRGADAVSFLERVPAGTVHVTTVYAWRNKEGRFKAVHSRHVTIGGPAPSQHYGYCQAW